MERRIGGMILLFALLISSLPISESSKKLNSVARKEDIPFIKCQVCQQLANQLYQQVNKKRAQISPKKISELQIIELTENACNLKKEEADWILRMDIVEKGDALELVEQDAEGQCNSECKTIERACQEVMGYYDTDVAEFLYKSKLQLDSLVNFLCDDLSKACSVKPPPVPKDRISGEPFQPKSSKEAEMEKILRSMEGMPGAPGMKMYSRDDLMNMQNFGDEDGDEDDEDDDGFPSKMVCYASLSIASGIGIYNLPIYQYSHWVDSFQQNLGSNLSFGQDCFKVCPVHSTLWPYIFDPPDERTNEHASPFGLFFH